MRQKTISVEFLRLSLCTVLILFILCTVRVQVVLADNSQLLLDQQQDQNETTALPVSYAGYKVLRIQPKVLYQLEYLRQLSNNDSQLDFWTHPTSLNFSVDVLAGGSRLAHLQRTLDNLHISHEPLIEDVESAITKEREAVNEPPNLSLQYRSGNPSTFMQAQNFFERYQRLSEIYDYIEALATENPRLASTFNIGKSYEGRDLRVIKIGTTGFFRKSKPAIFLDGGIHAREWVAVSTVLYIASRLIADYDVDPIVTKLVDHYDWFLLPVANPDGYEFSHTTDRMWRKTRSNTNSHWGCRGVDPNRNFDFHWNEVGTSNNPCSEIYSGHRAFSEIETRAIAEFIMKKKAQMKLYLAVHAYSQLWLTPWGYTHKVPENYDDMEKKAQVATEALAKKYGTDYRIGSSTNVLYAAAGGADDWAHGVAGIPYVYTVELRDKGRHGFLLPRSMILPTGEETWDAVRAISEEIRNHGRKS